MDLTNTLLVTGTALIAIATGIHLIRASQAGSQTWMSRIISLNSAPPLTITRQVSLIAAVESASSNSPDDMNWSETPATIIQSNSDPHKTRALGRAHLPTRTTKSGSAGGALPTASPEIPFHPTRQQPAPQTGASQGLSLPPEPPPSVPKAILPVSPPKPQPATGHRDPATERDPDASNATHVLEGHFFRIRGLRFRPTNPGNTA